MCVDTCLAADSKDSLQKVWVNETLQDTARFQALNEYYPDHSFSEPDSVLRFAEYHINLARRFNNEYEVAVALNEKAIAYYVIGDLGASLSHLEKAIEIRKKLKDHNAVARLTTNLGSIQRERKNYQDAFHNYSASLEIYKEEKDTLLQAEVTNNLGLLFLDIKEYNIASEYLLKALDLYSTVGKDDEIGNIWLNLGALCLERGSYKKALTYCRSAIPLLKAKNSEYSLAECYAIKSGIFQNLGQFDSGLLYINKALIINDKIKNEKQSLLFRMQLAELTFYTNVGQATSMGESLLTKIKEIDDLLLKKNVYKLLHKCYKAQGKFDIALTMYEKSVVYADSLSMNEKAMGLVRTRMQKDYEAKLVNSKIIAKAQEEQLRKKQLKRIVGICIMALLVIGAIFILYKKRVKQNEDEQNALIREIQELKSKNNSTLPIEGANFKLNKEKIESSISRKLNDTDWLVLQILFDDPVISNKGIADKAFLSVDGIGSSLRRMYVTFDIKESRYKKISLLMEVMKMSNT